MKSKKVKILSLVVVVIFMYFGCIKLIHIAEWNMTANATGGYPYEIGLTNVMITQCQLSCNGACCTGGTLCPNKDPLTCTMYSDVSGEPAGGDGNSALFSATAIGQSGLSAGGELIAGGMSSVSMDGGVLASTGGCFGCVAKTDNTFEKIYDYAVALFKK